ncbi:flagellar hook-length control protein FliK [Pseudodonghicola flavimaris]|uniref:Flagellar hook-length control protein FliK n=1 Tax=Pseudodonghicola flavimaris TaxID=3050036 RepID=A0ABT7EWR8_9RHOB|nr:flagellar hook-length control protein FliK [Pseudodonghicola flavimaris]MDK3016730.1 flagellar hook-length control protein FliK [Pseudodonghicola flavimaris]
MSGIGTLLSVLVTAPAAGRGLPAVEQDGFAALFSASLPEGVVPANSGGAGDPGSQAAQADLAQRLDTMGRQLDRLWTRDLTPEEEAAEVAGLSNDLAQALEDFTEKEGAVLLTLLAAQTIVATPAATEAAATAPDTSARALFAGALRAVGQALGQLTSLTAESPAPDLAMGTVGAAKVAGLEPAPTVVASDAEEAPAVAMAASASGPDIAEPLAAPAKDGDVAARIGAFIPSVPDRDGPASEGAEVSEDGVLPEDLVLSRALGRAAVPAPEGAELLSRIVALAGGAEHRDEPMAERRISDADILAMVQQDGGRPSVPDSPGRVESGRAEPARFAQVLADQVRVAEVSEGRTRIELAPRGLGGLEVDVTTADDGTLSVVVRAENSQVLNALRADRETLALALGDLGGGSLDLQGFSPQGDSGGTDRGGGSGEPGAEGAADATAPIGSVAAHEDVIGRGRLDIVT